ncbi:MAG: beta strand repeat-containing protein [Myxococcales bacterium]
MRGWHRRLHVAVLLAVAGVSNVSTRALAQVYQATADAGIVYVYDPVGRLVGVVTPTGDVAQYVYDPAGNTTQINRYDAGSLVVLGFDPSGTSQGSTIDVFGTGFTCGDTVTIGGQSATVVSCSNGELTVTVPAGSQGGVVSVSGGGNVSNSAWSLGVPDSGVWISGFTPDAGDAGSLLTITGGGFSPSAGDDQVLLNTTEASIVDAGSAALVVTVPPDTTSGRLTVSTNLGTAVSSGDFFTPPPGYDASIIVATGRTTVGGSAANLGPIAVSKFGLMLFDGQAGQDLTLAITSLSVSVTLYVFDPKGEEILEASEYAPTALSLPPLPMTGTYEIAVEPASSSATIGLQVISDSSGTLVAGNSPLAFQPSQAGQRGVYTFAGTTGLNLTLAFTSITFTQSLTVTVFEPRGSVLATGNIYSSGPIFQIPTLPADGTYFVVLSPYGNNPGQANVQLLEDLEGTIAVGGSAVFVSLVPGQYGHLTFDGGLGERVDLAVPTFSETPSGYTTIVVDAPPAESITGALASTTFSGVGHSELPLLPETGLYDLWIEPQSLLNLDAGFQLVLPDVSTLTMGTPATFSTSSYGQEGVYTFTATAGQNLSIAMTGCTFQNFVTGTVYGPTGNYLNGAEAYPTQTGAIDLINLPAGTYTLVLEPYGTNTGEVTVELFQDATGTVTTDGTPTAVSLSGGQRGEYTFSGSSGAYFGLGVTSFSTTPTGTNVAFSVYEPSGTLLVNEYATTNASFALPELPSTGTYTIRVEPNYATPTSLDLDLLSPQAGGLTVGSGTTFSSTEAGQDARYTFSGTSGQYLSLALTGSTFASATSVYVYAPNGNQAGSTAVYSGSSAVIDLAPLSQTGTYTVSVAPSGAGTGQLTLELFQDATGTVATNGTPTGISLAAGQRGEYTFSGNSGDYLGLGITSFTESPSGTSITVYVYEPNGTDWWNNSIYQNTSFALPQLPVSGTYTIRVEPYEATETTFDLALLEPETGTLTAGTPVTFDGGEAGQEGRYTFSGTAGQNMSLGLTANTFTAQTTVTVDGPPPNGSQVGYTGLPAGASGAIDLQNLTQTGTYTVIVDPTGAQTGQLTIELFQDATGTIATDGTPLAVSLGAGQRADYTFSGNSGDRIGGAVTSLSMTPSGSYAYLYFYEPSGADWWNTDVSQNTGFTLPVLPSSGTYTVRVEPSGATTFSANLDLAEPATGTLTAGTPLTFSSSIPGQEGVYTFSGTSGTNHTIYASGVTFPNEIVVTVYQPNGSEISSGSFTTSGSLTLSDLPATGTYTVVVNPSQTGTGSATLELD